jgi:hypothetical protein
VVTEEVAREALLSFVNSKCCYRSGAAGNLVIRELRQQTLCRVRGLCWGAWGHGDRDRHLCDVSQGQGVLGIMCVNGGDVESLL